ncbi:MAG: MlaD family protein [Saezia sp.]
MESKSRATTVGVFVLAMIAMMIATVLWFSQDRTERVAYDIITNRSAGGIVPHAAVELYGLSVGKVESVSFIEGKPGYVRIRLMVDKVAPINQATYATIASRGVTGASFIALADDDQQPLEMRASSLRAATPAAEVPAIPLRLGVLDSFTEGIAQFSARAEEVLVSLNRFMSEENEQRIFVAIENIGSAADQVAQLSASLNKDVMSEVKGVAQQATVTLKSLDALAVNANALVADVRKPDGPLNSVTEGAQALTHAANRLRHVTLPQIESAVENVSSTLRGAKRLIEKLEDQPDMLVLGNGEVAPGPGEAGYKSPYAR